MSDDELVTLKRMWNKTFDQLETEHIEGLSDRRHDSRIKEYQEKNYIVFSRKEIEILQGRISNEIWVLLCDFDNNPEYFDEYKLDDVELSEFKKKLERIVNGRK